MSNLLKIKDSKQLGLLIRAKRKELGIRIDQAALMIGISKNTLSSIENGGERVGLSNVIKVCHELGVQLLVKSE